jgi:hypothetical protein
LGELFSRPSQQEVETTRSLLDTLLTEARLYRTTADYKALLDFVVRLRNFAPYNAMLLQVQKPGLTYAASAVRPLSALVRATVAPLPRIGRQGFVFTTGGDRPLGGFGHDCAATGAAANSGVNNTKRQIRDGRHSSESHDTAQCSPSKWDGTSRSVHYGQSFRDRDDWADGA